MLAHAQHYLVESMGLEMKSISKLSARGRWAQSVRFIVKPLFPATLAVAEEIIATYLKH